MPKITDPRKDPMGAALKDFMAGTRGESLKVSSDIAVDDVIPIQYLFRDQEAMPEWELTALDHCKGKILDVGAGAGSHALQLQQMGFEVSTMDVSPGAVAVMKARGLSHSIHADIFEYEGDTFDTLLMMMNGIGLVGDTDGLSTFLHHARKLLKPGGQILLDSSDLTYLYEDATVLKPTDRYQGIIKFQMRYKDVYGDPFYWIYLDFEKMKSHAESHGYVCTLLEEGPHFEYLARLTPNGQGL